MTWTSRTTCRILRATAIIACAPYLVLKTAWLSGSHVGLPPGSGLREPDGFLTAANAVSLGLDSAVIVLALLLTRPWGRRVPSWLLTVPVFVATGLLTPIVAGFPLQLAVGLLGGGESAAQEAAREPFLDSWVYGVVYSGFIVQALALGALFVLYARERWAPRWPAVRTGRLPGRYRVAAGVSATAALAAGSVHLLWAAGVTAGMPTEQIAARTGQTIALEALFAALAVTTAAGVLRLTRPGPVRVPLVLTWVGGSALLCWGGWLLLATVTGSRHFGDARLLVSLTYVGQMLAGLLAAVVVTRRLTAPEDDTDRTDHRATDAAR